MKFSLLLASIPNAELWSKKRSETSLCNVRVEHNAIKCFVLFLLYFQAYHTRQNLFKVHLQRYTENSKCHFSKDVFPLWPFLCFYTRDYPRTFSLCFSYSIWNSVAKQSVRKLPKKSHFHTILKIKFLSENSILTKLQYFHKFFTPNFFDNFSREIRLINS